MHIYIFEKDNIAIYGSYFCTIHIIRISGILVGHQRYQKYGAPSQRIKLYFGIKLKNNSDLKFHFDN